MGTPVSHYGLVITVVCLGLSGKAATCAGTSGAAARVGGYEMGPTCDEGALMDFLAQYGPVVIAVAAGSAYFSE
jgi:hypothetical protein